MLRQSRSENPRPFPLWLLGTHVQGTGGEEPTRARSRPAALGTLLRRSCWGEAPGGPLILRCAAPPPRRRSRLAAAGTAWPGPDSTSGGGGVSGPCDGLRGGGGVRGPCWPGPASSAVR